MLACAGRRPRLPLHLTAVPTRGAAVHVRHYALIGQCGLSTYYTLWEDFQLFHLLSNPEISIVVNSKGGTPAKPLSTVAMPNLKQGVVNVPIRSPIIAIQIGGNDGSATSPEVLLLACNIINAAEFVLQILVLHVA